MLTIFWAWIGLAADAGYEKLAAKTEKTVKTGKLKRGRAGFSPVKLPYVLRNMGVRR